MALDAGSLSGQAPGSGHDGGDPGRVRRVPALGDQGPSGDGEAPPASCGSPARDQVCRLPADYQPLLILLAPVTASPTLSAAIVEAFIDSGTADLLAFLLDKHAPESVAGLARKVAAIPGMKLPAAAVRRWLPVVGRFSFQPGLLDDALSMSEPS